MRIIILLIAFFLTFPVMAQIAGNQWVDKQYSVTGGWSIEEVQGEYFLQLDENFKTSKGPDLKLFLITKTMSQIDKREALEKNSQFIAKLKSVKGEQRYQIPSESNPNNFKRLAIHCEEFSVVWGGVDF